MSDRVYVLNEGSIIAELEKEEISQVNIMECHHGRGEIT